MKYTLEEIKSFLLEPSFDSIHSDTVIEMALEDIERAIAHHEKLNKSNNGEGF